MLSCVPALFVRQGEPIAHARKKFNGPPAGLPAGAALAVLLTVSGAAEAGDIVIGPGGSLTGCGTFAGNVTIEGGGTLAPGTAGVNSGLGTLTLGSLILDTNALVDMDLAPAVNDLVNITTGGLVFNTTGSASVGVNLFAAGTANPYAAAGNFTLFTVTGGAIGNLNNFNILNPAAGANYTWGVTGGSVILTISVGPINGVWNVNAGGGWGDNGVWSGGTPASAGDSATFGAIITGPVTVNLNGNRTVGSVIFNNAASYTLAQGGGGTLVLDNLANPASITVSAGNHTIAAPLTFTSAGLTTSVAGGSALTLSGNVTGQAGLTLNGAGTVILGGTDSIAGDVVINAGTLDIPSGGNDSWKACRGGGLVFEESGSTVTSDKMTLTGSGISIGGIHTVRANATLTGRTGAVATLTLIGAPGAWTGKLDLTNNNLIIGSVTNTTTLATVRNQITQAAGVAAPANPWNGTGGITSSSAAAASTGGTRTGLGYASGAEYTALTGLTLFDSLAFNPTDTLVKYTLVGDANLDGTVNINDFFALSGHFDQPGDWSQGDFNYTGTVDINDFFAMSGNFGKTLAVGNLLPAAAAPEPASLVMMALAAPWLLCARKSRRCQRMKAAG